MLFLLKTSVATLTCPYLQRVSSKKQKSWLPGLVGTKVSMSSKARMAWRVRPDEINRRMRTRNVAAVGGEVVAVHFEDELPSDVVLADLGDDVDEEVEGVGGEGWVGEGLGVVEEGEGNFGIVLEAEERVVEEVGGESDAVELERGLHGVEGVVVVEEDLRYQFGVVLGCWVGE
ncbi:hypothetical protein M0R45_030551 [Rubus argutus]|uniref:Uncharacterized protein n=1 Tax=Rubus argutus TaxID=59490 RepID=A0AAW1WDK9_RUBAR